MRTCLPAVALAAMLVVVPSIYAQPASEAAAIAESRWSAGQLADAEKDLEALLKKNERDDAARFGIGLTRLFRAIERVTQSMHRYGFRPGDAFGMLSLMGAPMPPRPTVNQTPQPVRYEDLRKIVETFVADIEGVDRVLAEIKAENRQVRIENRAGAVGFRRRRSGDGR